MKVTIEIIKRIRQDFAKRKIKEDLTIPSNLGRWEVELNRRVAISMLGDFSDCIFVITEKHIYHNGSLENKDYCVYAYDKNGNYTEEMSPRELGRDFFKNIKFIENEIMG